MGEGMLGWKRGVGQEAGNGDLRIKDGCRTLIRNCIKLLLESLVVATLGRMLGRGRRGLRGREGGWWGGQAWYHTLDRRGREQEGGIVLQLHRGRE